MSITTRDSKTFDHVQHMLVHMRIQIFYLYIREDVDADSNLPNDLYTIAEQMSLDITNQIYSFYLEKKNILQRKFERV